jgi:hypothetical protein
MSPNEIVLKQSSSQNVTNAFAFLNSDRQRICSVNVATFAEGTFHFGREPIRTNVIQNQIALIENSEDVIQKQFIQLQEDFIAQVLTLYVCP